MSYPYYGAAHPAYGGYAPAPAESPAAGIAMPAPPSYFQNGVYVKPAAPVAAPPAAPAAAAYSATASYEDDSESAAFDPLAIQMKLDVTEHFNIPEVLAHNLVSHPYYRELGRFTTMEEIVDEIYNEVKSVEPMMPGKNNLPSTALFLLYKLLTFKLNKPQINGKGRRRLNPHATESSERFVSSCVAGLSVHSDLRTVIRAAAACCPRCATDLVCGCPCADAA
jgi:hypothetical protein